MSQDNESNPYFFDEDKQEMVIAHDDLVNLRDFYTHFKIEEPKFLKIVLDECIPDATKFDFQKQLMVRQALAETIANADHPLFKLDVFDEIRKPNEEIANELRVRFELNEMLKDQNI